MSINCKSLKEYIENAFSMPFVVNSTMTDGESRYSCHPDNEGEVLFNSTVYIHNNVRIIVEIEPQRHGGEFIEVHHITPVSMLGSGYKINIDEDLIPVCSNCHSMLHKKNPPYLPDELKSIIKSVRENHKQVIGR